ncbi:MAG: T9SS type A sorting domain-containing protein [Flavobacteriia bacterium]|nr:T9SS type A sorting domain-containing protein [Flavobacteriia bacterium]
MIFKVTSVEIYNLNSQKIIESNDNYINIEKLNNGMYYYKIYSNDKILNGKLIIKH